MIGSGPAGFYTCDDLLKKKDLNVQVDLFDRLPTPYGLVRFGVAPDHQKIKSVIKQFERTAGMHGFRFLGNVTMGRDLTHDELVAHYDQVAYCVGAETDRRLWVDGEDLDGSHPATTFVAWYNGHPEHRDLQFDLQTERAVVVGVGDVAMDVSRVLLRSREELGKTDIAGYALEQLKRSNVTEVVCLGRRGPAQAAFAQKELKDIAKLEEVDVIVDKAQVDEAMKTVDELEPMFKRKLEYLAKLAEEGPTGAPKRLRLEFLASPTEIIGNDGKVAAVKIERNALVEEGGRVRPKGTGDFTTLETRCIFRSVGYHGVPLEGVPFDKKGGVIPNVDGRVTDGSGGEVLKNVYAVGWIKRGPTGVIGTNKTDAVATVKQMLADIAGKSAANDQKKSAQAIDALLAERGVNVVTFEDWKKLDALELAAGEKLGKIRDKFTTVESMLEALGRKA